jgi:AcrR family transcriptional regulator
VVEAVTNTMPKEEGRQAQKAKATREKIIAAVIALITEGGFAAASSSEITKRSGYTWGAVQHHFGGKEEILTSILDISHEKFIQLTSVAELRAGSLADRVDLFVDKMWEHYQSELYLAATEITLATRATRTKISIMAKINVQAEEHLVTMRDVFGDQVGDEQLLEALVFTHRFLVGLSVDQALEPAMPYVDKNLRRIKLVLLTMLSII